MEEKKDYIEKHLHPDYKNKARWNEVLVNANYFGMPGLIDFSISAGGIVLDDA